MATINKNGTLGNAGTSGGSPTAGTNGGSATFTQNGMIGADSTTVNAIGGVGGAGGNGIGLGIGGANGGGGGLASITLNGNIFNAPTGTTLSLDLRAVGGNGGLAGTGTPNGQMGNGGNATVTANGNIIQTNKIMTLIELSALAYAGNGTTWGNATATVNGNIIQTSKATGEVLIQAQAAFASGPDSPANNGNLSYGTKTATVSGNIVQGNINDVEISSAAYYSNGTANLNGNIIQTNASNTGEVLLTADATHIFITNNKVQLGQQSLFLWIDPFAPYDTTIQNNEFKGTGLNAFTFQDFSDPGPHTDTVSVNLVNHTFIFNGQNNTLTGFNSVTLIGNVSANLQGGPGDDILNGGDGDDVIDGGGGNDIIFGGKGNDILTGGDGNDILHGNDGDDTLDGGNGDDTLLGGAGDDTLIVSSGTDILDGNTDPLGDTVDFRNATAGVNANLGGAQQTFTSSFGNVLARDTFLNIQNITGSAFDDTLTGDGNGNTLKGMGGNDTLVGAGGNDTLDGGTGNDTAVYTGTFAQYTVAVGITGNGTVTDNTVARDGTDGLTSIEFIQFSNGTFNSATQLFTPNGPVNHAPVANADPGYTVNEDNTLTVNAANGVLTNDTDADADILTASVVTGPSHAASFALNPNGSFNYTPAANFHGTDSFVYQANDGHGGTANATATVTIASVNDAPVANNDPGYSTNEDAALAVNAASGVLANDTDVDGDTLTASVVTGPTHAASFTLNANGAFNYTPAANFNGSDSFVYQASDGHGGTANATASITIASINDAPAGTDRTIASAANAAYTFAASDFGFTDPNDSPANALLSVKITTLPAAGTLTDNGVAVSAGQFVPAADIAGSKLVFTPAPNASGNNYGNFTFQVQDNGGTANGGVDLDQSPNTITLNVSALNHAPVLDASKTPVLATEAEDSGPATVGSGTLVSSLVDFASPSGQVDNVTDPDAAAQLGIALTGTDTANGSWAYSTDNGVIWHSVGAVSDAGALLLAADANTRLYFRPSANFNGTVANAITFRAWDQSSGSNGGTANASVNGGATAFSAASDSADISITAVNDAPMLDTSKSPVLAAELEDAGAPVGAVGTLISSLVDFAVPAGGLDNVTDIDTGALLGIALIGAATGHGNWFYSTNNGSAWTAVGAVSDASALLLAADANTRLYFQPNANFNGPTGGITFRAWDQTSGSNGGTANASLNGGTTAFSLLGDLVGFVITPVNDAPVGTDKTINTAENAPYTFAAADFGFSDPVDAALPSGANTFANVIISSLPTAGSLTYNNIAVTLNQSIAVANLNLLVFTPAANASGNNYGNFTFQVQDNGGTANGGVDLDQSPNTMTVNVAPSTNHAPVAADDSYTASLNTALVVPAAGVLANDTDADSNPLTSILVSSAGHGTVTLNPNGSFTYTPAANYSGSDSFTYKANDGSADSNIATAHITINPGQILFGTPGNDTLTGGPGDDTLVASAGTDTLDGAGNTAIGDTADFRNATSGVIVKIIAGQQNLTTSGLGKVTLANIENLTGSAFNDSLTGDGGNNTLTGGAGNDTLNGGAGTDTASYRDATTNGLSVSLSLGTSSGGGLGNDTLSSIENLIGSAFNDTLTGNTGANTLTGGAGNDTLNGLGGIDTADYSDATSDGLVVDLGLGTSSGGGDGNDTLANIENLTGSAFNDTLIGNAFNNVLSGGAGDDILIASKGTDTLDGGTNTAVGDTADFRNATSGVSVSIIATQQNLTSSGLGPVTLVNIENLTGSAFNDTLVGDGSNNTLDGGAGNDTLLAGGGDDILIASKGTDTLTGGLNGTAGDTADFRNATSGVSVSIIATQQDLTANGLGKVTLIGIENLTGSAFNDTLTGDTGNNTLTGGAGNDTLDGGVGIDTANYSDATSNGLIVDLELGTSSGGGLGNDTLANIENLNGSAFNDSLTGDAGNNTIWGQLGNDTLLGMAGDDTLQGGAGGDTLDGGTGTNTADYSDATSNGLVVNLALGTSSGGGLGNDTLTNIQNVIGSSYNDTLTGDAGNNLLTGGGGNDTLLGVAGDDTLQGGAGDDILDGGTGTNTADYSDATSDGLAVNLGLGTSSGGGLGNDTLTNIQNVTGSAHNDTLIGDAGDNMLTGGAGDDTIVATAGTDLYEGGSFGNDTLSLERATSGVTLSLEVDLGPQRTVDLTGNGLGVMTIQDFENLTGSDHDDHLTLIVNLNTGQLQGGGGDDTLAILGHGTMDGGAGTDTADFSSSNVGWTVNLTSGQAFDGHSSQQLDTLISIENAIGTGLADTLAGSAGDNVLTGRAGDDTLVATAGNDTLDGGLGEDTADYSGGQLFFVAGATTDGLVVNLALGMSSGGGLGNDTLVSIEDVTGSAHNDTLIGDAGNNLLIGNGGNDLLRGGGGNDRLNGGYGANGVTTADYSDATSDGLVVNLLLGTSSGGGDGNDSLTNIDNVTGSDYSATLIGNNNANVLTGGAGDDTLTGNGGNDTLVGGAGSDTLNGGDGNDILIAGTGNDAIDGGTGLNVAYFTGAEGQYTSVSLTSVTGGPDGDDTLANIQRLKFLSPTQVGDADNNGAGDLIFQKTNGDLQVQLQNPASTLSNITGVGSTWKAIGTGQFTADSDRNAGLLLQNSAGGSLEIITDLAGTPTTTAITGATVGLVTATTFTGWTAIDTGDFNGDGASDILLHNTSNNAVEIAYMNQGAGEPIGRVDSIVAIGFGSIVGVGDFNSDGKSDILLQSGSGGPVRVSLNNDSALSVINVAAGTGFDAIGTGDFDGDGKSDIILRNSTTGAAQIWLMDGATRLGSPVDVSAPAGYTLLGAEDVDANGYSDLLWQNHTTGAVEATEFMAGLANTTVAFGVTPGSTFTLVASTGGG